MNTVNDQPPPPPPGEAEFGDAREEFERLSRADRDKLPARDFIAHKIEIVRSDPRLSEEEKRAAIEELNQQLRETEQ